MQSIIALMLIGILFLVLPAIIVAMFVYESNKREKRFKLNNEYYDVTHNNFHNVYRDKGRLGEYLIYECLRDLSGNKKFLFNLYIPREDGGTSEIDVLMLHETGIYVFESKNYKGWIFGSENNIYWTQCLRRNGKTYKEKFYNPIMQNKKHIDCLANLISCNESFPFYSFIVFSDRCELKRIEMLSDSHKVIKRNNLREFIPMHSSDSTLSAEKIEKLYALLYPYSQTSEKVRAEHKKNINNAYSNNQSSGNPIRYCPKCGFEMSLISEKNNYGVLKQHWKCLNFKECGYCIYVTKNIESTGK